jgi:hypothetical protein
LVDYLSACHAFRLRLLDGNAIFAASGACVRYLPIRPDAVLQALNTPT